MDIVTVILETVTPFLSKHIWRILVWLHLLWVDPLTCVVFPMQTMSI